MERLKTRANQYNINLDYIHREDTRDLTENFSYNPDSLFDLVGRLNVTISSIKDKSLIKAVIEGSIVGTNGVLRLRRTHNV